MIYPLDAGISVAGSIPCHDGTGTLKATATGGVGTNYSYLWYRINQDATETAIPYATNETLETTTGKYRVKTTDRENNTAISDVLELPHPDLLTAGYTVVLPSAHDASSGSNGSEFAVMVSVA